MKTLNNIFDIAILTLLSIETQIHVPGILVFREKDRDVLREMQ